MLKFVPAKLVSKLPVLNEDKSIGEDSALMAAYEAQANAKVVVKKSQAQNQNVDDDGFQTMGEP